MNFPALSAYPITGSGNVKSSFGQLGGVFVGTATGATLAFYDDAGTGTSTPLVAPFTVAAGTWYPLPFAFGKGLNVVATGTLTATVAAA